MEEEHLLAPDEFVEVREGDRTVWGFVRAQGAVGFRLEVHEIHFNDRKKNVCDAKGKRVVDEIFVWSNVKVRSCTIRDGSPRAFLECNCWIDNGVTISEFYGETG